MEKKVPPAENLLPLAAVPPILAEPEIVEFGTETSQNFIGVL
jgi:hypothetical protein